jgi:hypothetical protein
MKKSFLFLSVFSFLFVSISSAEKIKLTWDQMQNVDGVRIYHAKRYYVESAGENQSFWDYDNPICEVPVTENSCTYELIGIDDKQVKYLFIARSYIGDKESANSNEVNYIYDLITPPAPINLSGSYSKTDKKIILSWTQPPEQWCKVELWRVYYRIDGNEYTELGIVDDENNLTLNTDFDAAPAGAITNVEFTVVAYRRSGKFSENSTALVVPIDRTDDAPPLPEPQNLKIEIQVH